MKTPALFAIAILAGPARADTAFFSADGKTVTFPALARSGLFRLTIVGGQLDALPLPAELKDKEITAVARGAEGEVLFMADDAVWAMKDGEPAKKIVALAPLKLVVDFFVAAQPDKPVTDWMFVSAGSGDAGGGLTFHARKPGQKAFGEVFCRRVHRVDAGCFTAEGRFFFAGEGDVWEGGFEVEDEPGGRLATLVGARIAPLAALNTDSANGGGQWVQALGVAGKWLYAGLGGRHMGTIVRMPLPAEPLWAPGTEEFPDVKAQHDVMRKALEKTETLVADTEGLTAFAVCEVKGKPRVFYRAEGDENGIGLWLWDGTGDPKRIANEPRE